MNGLARQAPFSRRVDRLAILAVAGRAGDRVTTDSGRRRASTRLRQGMISSVRRYGLAAPIRSAPIGLNDFRGRGTVRHLNAHSPTLSVAGNELVGVRTEGRFPDSAGINSEIQPVSIPLERHERAPSLRCFCDAGEFPIRCPLRREPGGPHRSVSRETRHSRRLRG